MRSVEITVSSDVTWKLERIREVMDLPDGFSDDDIVNQAVKRFIQGRSIQELVAETPVSD